MNDHFAEDLKKANDFHGHTCTGIIFGVRIARLGLSYLGIEDPVKNKDFMVFLEVDRCLADAVLSVTGCTLGKRRLKWYDYGKMAATFVDINTRKGVRITTHSHHNAPEDADLVSFWSAIPDEELFKLEPVTVDLKPEDLPGKPSRKMLCEQCGEAIMDGRDLLIDGKVLCKPCANGAYYEKR